MTFIQWAANIDTLPQNQGIGPGITRGPWDYIVLGGEVVPGVPKVDVEPGDGLDIQKPKGGKGATIVDNGDPPAKVKITLELLPDEVEEFRDFIIPILRQRNKDGGRQPLEVSHPMTEMWGISVLAIGQIRASHPKPGGTMTITMDAHEWKPGPAPVKRVTTVRTSDNLNSFGLSPFDPQSPSGIEAMPSVDDLLSGLE